MKKILIFDTETTGLPPKGGNWETNYDNFPYVAQLAWRILDENQKLLFQFESLIDIGDNPIHPKATEVNGITNEICSSEGLDGKMVYSTFLFHTAKADILVGHNIYFDISIIKANLLRLGVYEKEKFNEWLHKDKRFDTMMEGYKLTGGNKWPKLTELYKFLFNEETENAHSAMGDVKATERCYYKLIIK